MSTFIVPVSHAPQSPGAQYKGANEYDLSVRLVPLIVAQLQQAGLVAHTFDPGKEDPSRPYSWVKEEKIKRTNAIARQVEGALAVQFHWQRASGVCAIHHARSEKGRQYGRILQPALVKGLDSTSHWKGVFGNPNADYWDDPNYTIGFLSRTCCPALIVELGSILRGKEWYERLEQVALVCASALKKVAGVKR